METKDIFEASMGTPYCDQREHNLWSERRLQGSNQQPENQRKSKNTPKIFGCICSGGSALWELGRLCARRPSARYSCLLRSSGKAAEAEAETAMRMIRNVQSCLLELHFEKPAMLKSSFSSVWGQGSRSRDSVRNKLGEQYSRVWGLKQSSSKQHGNWGHIWGFPGGLWLRLEGTQPMIWTKITRWFGTLRAGTSLRWRPSARYSCLLRSSGKAAEAEAGDVQCATPHHTWSEHMPSPFPELHFQSETSNVEIIVF